MADWRKVAIAALLADGKIDETEVKVLKKELYADGKIDAGEVKFLIDLREAAQKKAKARKQPVGAAFERLFFKAIEDNVLRDGKIDEAEVRWLRNMLFADGKIDANERRFLATLKKKAKDKVPPSFVKLCSDAMAKAAKAKAAKAARAGAR
jgi:uncharacterized membrane protein YebE (DUF533 family)